MYNEAYRKANRIISDGEHVFADPHNYKSYQAINCDAKKTVRTLQESQTESGLRPAIFSPATQGKKNA
jgi:hypothetical protein